MSPSQQPPQVKRPSGEGSKSAPLKGWQQLLVALSCATLLYGGQIRVITDPRNRMHEFWTLESGLCYVMGIAVLGLAIYLFRILASRSRWVALADHLLWMAVILSLPCLVLRSVPATPYPFLAPFIPAMIVLVISSFRPSTGIIAKLEKGALLFSPLFLLLAFQLLTFQAWGGPKEIPTHRFAPRKAYPVFIFVFDEWSYKRSVQNGEFLPSLKNLRALARQSFFFEEAASIAKNTWPSLVQFIYQTSDDLVFLAETPHWKQKSGGSIPTTGKQSLFSLAGTHGYNSALIGFHIPQRRILGDQVGYVDTQTIRFEPQTFPGKVWRKFWKSLAYTVEWWIEREAITSAIQKEEELRRLGIKPGEKSYSRILQEKVVRYLSTRLNEETCIRGRDLVRHVEMESVAMIRTLPRNSIFLSHIPIPHSPFIFDEQGVYLGSFQGIFRPLDMEGYLRQIGYLDTIIGRYLAELVATGKFDEAMIVVTSDHSYRYDPLENNFQHIPFLVKLPHQTEAVQIKQPFSLSSMKPVFDAVMAGRLDDAHAALSAGQD